ncbi:MAG: serine/threonine-protein kinase, partial [Myxococcota bacterium]
MLRATFRPERLPKRPPPGAPESVTEPVLRPSLPVEVLDDVRTARSDPASAGGSERETKREPIFRVGELVSGQFEVRAVIGEGGMAQVVEAHDHVLDRRVALKAAWPNPRIPPLRNEARALAAFRHPSLVTVHAIGEHRGIEYIVMERIYGVPLSEHLRRRHQAAAIFAIDEVLDLLVELAEGVAVVHRAGVAHRDIKPGNVMLTPDRRVVLMDFGLVLPEVSVGDQTLVAGSPPYMAPEALTNTVETGEGHLVDLYALGVLAFELLTGERPFAETTMEALYRVHGTQAVPDVRALRPEVPLKLGALLGEMLAKAPQDRPPSAESVAWRLAGIRDALRAAEERARGMSSLPAARSAPPSTPPESEASSPSLPEAPSVAYIDVLIVEDDED